MPFTIRDIPATMRKKDMPIGAAMMDRWFTGAASTMTLEEKRGNVPITTIAADRIETRLVTMRWVRSFGRIELVHSRLLQTWAQPQRLARALPTIATRVRTWQARQGIASGAAFRFGDLSRPTVEVDVSCQINFEDTVGSVWDTLDDFYAAIGRGIIKLAVAGEVVPTANGYTLVVDEVGTYLRDTYDFIGSQELGFWSRYGVEKLLFPPLRIPLDPGTADNDGEWSRGNYYHVNNDSFNDYRRLFGKGADFFVFSDIARHRLARPVTIEVGA